MFGKPKPKVNVDEAVAALLRLAEQDPMFGAVLKGMMAQSAIRMQAMAKAWIDELTKKGAPAETIAAARTLLDMDVARQVRARLVK
jgi:hypothetical protein